MLVSKEYRAIAKETIVSLYEDLNDLKVIPQDLKTLFYNSVIVDKNSVRILNDEVYLVVNTIMTMLLFNKINSLTQAKAGKKDAEVVE